MYSSLLNATFRLEDNAEPFVKDNPNCCTLTKSMLKALIEKDPGCSNGYSRPSGLRKCDPCPPGCCRIGRYCYHPRIFLHSAGLQAKCKYFFDTQWPHSAGRPDMTYRSCSRQPPTASLSNISWCALPRRSLREMRGLSNLCLDNTTSVATIFKVCTTCPAGTCRIGNGSCYCPHDFFQNAELHNKCIEYFGVAWPHSNKVPDREWSKCKGMYGPVIKKTNGTVIFLEPTRSSSEAVPGHENQNTTNNLKDSGTSTFTTLVPTSSMVPLTSQFTGIGNSSASDSEEEIATPSRKAERQKPNGRPTASAKPVSSQYPIVSAKPSPSIQNDDISGQRGTTPTPTLSGSRVESKGLVTLEVVGIGAGVVSALIAVLGLIQWLLRKAAKVQEPLDANIENLEAATIGA